MSEITRGVLRMPPELWGDDPLSVAQRHARYVEAADTIDRLQAECDALRADAERYRWLRVESAKSHDFYSNDAIWMVSRQQGGMGQNFFGNKIDAAIDAAKEGK